MTNKEAAERSGIPIKLINAVVMRVGKDSLADIRNHGADSGFSGFTYTRDTVSFFKRHRAAIVEMVNRMADDLGENPIDMVAGFGCIAGHAKRDDYDHSGRMTEKRRRELQEYYPGVSRALYGRLTDDDDTIANALAWFALEEVARAFEE